VIGAVVSADCEMEGVPSKTAPDFGAGAAIRELRLGRFVSGLPFVCLLLRNREGEAPAEPRLSRNARNVP